MAAATYQGKPCSAGHSGERYASTRCCVTCTRDAARGRRRPYVAVKDHPERPSKPRKVSVRESVMTDALETLLDEARAAGAYNASIALAARPAVTLHYFGRTYTPTGGGNATPCNSVTAEGETMAAALAAALDKMRATYAAESRRPGEEHHALNRDRDAAMRGAPDLADLSDLLG